jgi:hypothetical protein
MKKHFGSIFRRAAMALALGAVAGTAWGDEPAPTKPVGPATAGLGRMPPNPRLHAGFANERINTTSEKPTGSGSVDKEGKPVPWDDGAFRTVCEPSHYAFDDPIVFPGQVGKSHLHVFFGNTLAQAGSTAESLRTTGNSTCRGGTANRSSYWVPAMIDMTGLPVTPSESTIYYKGGFGGVRKQDIKPIPEGLRMIAGDPMNSSNGGDHVFVCHKATKPRRHAIITDCEPGDLLEMNVSFPQCWNGRDLDSPDHKSHMAYPRAPHGCPSSHPVPLAAINFVILYPLTKPNEAANWRLSSDTYKGPAGYSAHADWFNGWRKEISDAWTNHCLVPGWDCHSHLLGDGRAVN